MRRALPALLAAALATACRRPTVDAGPRAETSAGSGATSAPSTAPPPVEPPAAAAAAEVPPAPSASAQRHARAPAPPVVLPRALLSTLPSPGAHPSAGFTGPVDPALDAAWVSRLATAKVATIAWNGGGVSLTFKLKLADGHRAVFKPAQALPGSNHVAEIAAFHLDRLLGLGRVAVVVGRALPADALADAVTDPKVASRVARELAVRDGLVTGAMIAWHAAPLTSDDPPRGWRASLSGEGPIDDAIRARAGELTDLALFDFLLDNTDRWSGGNVLSLGKGGPLVFLDNASALLPSRARRRASLARELSQLCRFRRRAVDAVTAPRDLADELARSVALDPSGARLEPVVVDALRARVAALREHLARCRREHGDGVWLDE
ncbi:MAG: hypothetical protein IT374_18540 [Polyangiaceae bacterium]|nr:hypothetical protein [Polyangiaceae bacterium]